MSILSFSYLIKVFAGFTMNSFSADVSSMCSNTVHFISSLALVEHVKVVLPAAERTHISPRDEFQINRLRNRTSGAI